MGQKIAAGLLARHLTPVFFQRYGGRFMSRSIMTLWPADGGLKFFRDNDMDFHLWRWRPCLYHWPWV